VGPGEDDPTTKSGKPDRFVEVHNPQERLEFFMGDCPLLRGCWDKLFRRDFVEQYDLKFAEGVFDEESLFTTPAYLHFKRIYLLNEYLHRYYQNPISSTYNLMRDMKRRDDNMKTWEETYYAMKNDGSLEENHELAEWFFIINYYIRSLVFATGRGIPYDLETVKRMQRNVLEWFPNFKQNKSLQARQLYKEPMKLIDIPLSEDNFADYNAAWEEIVKAYPEGL
jgi:hypothetical protein